MLRVSSKEVIARIAAAAGRGDAPHSNEQGVVAFDGDGTLWSGDIGDELFFALLAHADIRAPAKTRLIDEARSHNLDTTGDGVAIAKRIYEQYTLGRYPERKICEMMGWLCAGWSRAEVDQFAERLLPAGVLEARLHPEVIEIALAARELGLRTVIVSASPRSIVEAAARRVGFADVVATTSFYDEKPPLQTMLARVQEPIPYDDGKVINLRALIGADLLVAAFGDNTFDVPMLQAARVAVAVRPKARLLAREAEVSALLTIDAESATALEPRG